VVWRGDESAYSEAFEELEERVGWPVAAGGRAWRGGAGECLLLEGEVGVDVDAVGGANVFVYRVGCAARSGIHAL
jgi:hypothetical protein